jgi:hypothetical protein
MLSNQRSAQAASTSQMQALVLQRLNHQSTVDDHRLDKLLAFLQRMLGGFHQLGPA